MTHFNHAARQATIDIRKTLPAVKCCYSTYLNDQEVCRRSLPDAALIVWRMNAVSIHVHLYCPGVFKKVHNHSWNQKHFSRSFWSKNFANVVDLVVASWTWNTYHCLSLCLRLRHLMIQGTLSCKSRASLAHSGNQLGSMSQLWRRFTNRTSSATRTETMDTLKGSLMKAVPGQALPQLTSCLLSTPLCCSPLFFKQFAYLIFYYVENNCC